MEEIVNFTEKRSISAVHGDDGIRVATEMEKGIPTVGSPTLQDLIVAWSALSAKPGVKGANRWA